jgi:hypothetical protein
MTRGLHRGYSSFRIMVHGRLNNRKKHYGIACFGREGRSGVHYGEGNPFFRGVEEDGVDWGDGGFRI